VIYKSTINDDNRIMATGEAVAHLNYLCENGSIARESDKDDANWYRRS